MKAVADLKKWFQCTSSMQAWHRGTRSTQSTTHLARRILVTQSQKVSFVHFSFWPKWKRTVDMGGFLQWRRNRIEWRERNYVFLSVSRYVLTPGQCYASQTSKGTFFWVGKVCFYVFREEKNLIVCVCVCLCVCVSVCLCVCLCKWNSYVDILH